MSPTIRHKFRYFHSCVQRAKDRRQKFHFSRLPFAVRPRNVKLNLSNILSKGYGTNEIKLYKLAYATTPQQKKTVEDYLVEKGVVRCRGIAQYGRFLGMLAFIGMPIAIDLISKMFGKGLPCLY